MSIIFSFMSNSSITCPEANQLVNWRIKAYITSCSVTVLLRHPFICELLLRALLSSDKRQEDGAMLQEWGSSLPHAFALGFLSFCLLPAKAACLTPDPSSSLLPRAGILPLCIPLSIHYTIPPSMSLSQRQQCGVGSRLAGMWLSVLHIRDLQTSALIKPPSPLWNNTLLQLINMVRLCHAITWI